MQINQKYSQLASDEQIENASKSLQGNGFNVEILDSKDNVKEKVFSLLPKGAEVFTMTSMTLEALGIPVEVNDSGNYNSVRQKLNTMDKNQTREKRKLGAAPDWALGSVHAITQDGKVMIASNTGSQLPAYAYGAGNVIWVVSTKKIVKDLDEGMKRIYEYSLPLEDERAQQAYGVHSNVSKILIVNEETVPNRTTILLVKEDLGY